MASAVWPVYPPPYSMGWPGVYTHPHAMLHTHNMYAASHLPQIPQTSAMPWDTFVPATRQNHLHAPANVQQPNDMGKRLLKHLALAGMFFAAGLLLRQFPVTRHSFKLFSPDWKDWARIGAGILAVGQINKALQWKPAPWLGALETMAVMHPLVFGLARKNLGHLAVMAPMVAGVVQATHTLDDTVSARLKAQYGIPPMLTRIVIAIGMMCFGVKAYPKVYQHIASKGYLGREIQAQATQQAGRVMVGTEVVVCSRGCCSSVVCMNEVADYVGGLGNWLQSKPVRERSGV